MSPVELQRLRRFILDTAVIEAISDEMRAVVEAVWPELVHKLPLRSRGELFALRQTGKFETFSPT